MTILDAEGGGEVGWALHAGQSSLSPALQSSFNRTTIQVKPHMHLSVHPGGNRAEGGVTAESHVRPVRQRGPAPGGRQDTRSPEDKAGQRGSTGDRRPAKTSRSFGLATRCL